MKAVISIITLEDYEADIEMRVCNGVDIVDCLRNYKGSRYYTEVCERLAESEAQLIPELQDLAKQYESCAVGFLILEE